MTISAIVGLIVLIAAIALAVRFIIRREKRLGNDIVQDVKDLVE